MLNILILYVLTLILKLSAYFWTGYLILLADSMHTLTDIVSIGILIYSGKLSRKPSDLSHPFGHEMVRNIASLIVAVSFITVISFELLREGFLKLQSPASNYGDPRIAISVELIVLVILGVALIISSRRKEILSRTMFVESLNDSLSTVAAIVGIVLVWYGYPLFDGIVAILIAVMIFYNSAMLIKQNTKFLLGLSPASEFYQRVEKLATSVEEVMDVHDMVAVYIGENKIHLDMHITVDGKMSVEEADDLSFKVAEKLKREIPEIGYVMVHVCPHFRHSKRYLVEN